MDGELQKRENEDGVAPASAGQSSRQHDEDHPRGSEGDVDLVAHRMGRVGGGDEMGEVAAARRLVQRPVVKGDAEQDGEDEIERGEEVRCAVAGREMRGAEAGEVAGEEMGGPVAGVGGVMEADVAVCPADEGCGA